MSAKQSRSNELINAVVIPIYRNDCSTLNDDFACLKKRFTTEMKRLENEMTCLSKNLKQINELECAMRNGLIKEPNNDCGLDLDTMQSPLIEESCGSRMVKLQFDVSQFEPNEVSVKVCKNTLHVSALHDERSPGCVVHNEFTRECVLPPNTNAACIESCITTDGILVLKIPLYCSKVNSGCGSTSSFGESQ